MSTQSAEIHAFTTCFAHYWSSLTKQQLLSMAGISENKRCLHSAYREPHSLGFLPGAKMLSTDAALLSPWCSFWRSETEVKRPGIKKLLGKCPQASVWVLCGQQRAMVNLFIFSFIFYLSQVHCSGHFLKLLRTSFQLQVYLSIISIIYVELTHYRLSAFYCCASWLLITQGGIKPLKQWTGDGDHHNVYILPYL